jgi:uncharacterized protein YlxW (UPF0749 family)
VELVGRYSKARVNAIKRERVKWAEKAIEEVVPLDIARAKQTDLATQLKQAEARLPSSRHRASNMSS